MKKGFTLIELLVVVLIIGILAAVALPQYTKTVERSRMTEAITSAKALTDAIQRCMLVRAGLGECMHFDVLDVDIPFTSYDEARPSRGAFTKDFEYLIDDDTLYIYRRNGQYHLLVWPTATDDLPPGTMFCMSENPKGIPLCKSVGKLDGRFGDDGYRING